MRKTLQLSIIFLFLLPVLAFAQNQAVLPDAGLTPESPFYFLDKFGEALRSFFTFNPEAKAHLQITFAAERIAEIKMVLEAKGVKAPGLEVAQSRLQAHLAGAAAILDNEKSKGRDISKLASDLDDEFEGPKSALEETFKTQKQTLKNQENELKAKIRDARRAGNTAEVEALIKQLAEVKAQKELLEQGEEDQEETLEKEEERIREEMEDKAETEKKIRKAEREKQGVLDEAAEEGITLPPETFNAFNEHISEAKAALAAGKFEESKHHAEEAKESLEKVDDAMDDLEEAKDDEEELKDEQKGEIEKERKEAEEKVRKVEEKLREAGKMEEEEEDEEKMKHDEENGASSKQTPQVVTVEMRSGRFDDNVVDIKRGDTVRWMNRDSQPHWPASNPHPVHTGLRGFDALKPIGPGESYEFTLTQPGTFGYHDHLNPSVTGRVIVK